MIKGIRHRSYQNLSFSRLDDPELVAREMDFHQVRRRKTVHKYCTIINRGPKIKLFQLVISGMYTVFLWRKRRYWTISLEIVAVSGKTISFKNYCITKINYLISLSLAVALFSLSFLGLIFRLQFLSVQEVVLE